MTQPPVQLPPPAFAALAYERPDRLSGKTHRIRTVPGWVYVTVNLGADGRPIEVFCHLGKCGTTDYGWTEAVGRLISVSLQHGVTMDEIVKQLRGISEGQVYWQGGGVKIQSVPDAVARVLAEYVDSGPPLEYPSVNEPASGVQ